jgi:hypothetical protein
VALDCRQTGESVSMWDRLGRTGETQAGVRPKPE